MGRRECEGRSLTVVRSLIRDLVELEDEGFASRSGVVQIQQGEGVAVKVTRTLAFTPITPGLPL